MGGESFTDFKSLNGIEISWLVQVLSNFNWFQRSAPLGGGRLVDGGWRGYQCEGVSHAHMHAHMHAHACMHTCTCTCMLNMLNMDASMLVAICNFYTCIHVHVCVCMHAHVCACMWGHPHATRCPQTSPTHLPPPELQGAQIRRITITLEWIEIIQFCLKVCDPLTVLHTNRLGLMCR